MPIYTNDPYDDDLFPMEPSLRSSIGIGPKVTKAIDDATKDWLDNHPEATTTVEDNSLTNAKFMDGSVNSRVIEDESITTDDIADLAITTPKIADLAINTPKIADNAVTADKVASSAADGLRIMSTTQLGVAKVGAGLAMNNDALELNGGNIAPAVTAWLNAHPEATTTVQDNSITDAKLVQSGGILEEVDSLEYALYAKKNLVTEILVGYVRSNNNGVVSNPWQAEGYVCAIADVNAGDKITINGEWANNSFGFFADNNGNVIGRAYDYIDSTYGSGGYVFTVPDNATKLYFSYNTSNNIHYETRGYVVLIGHNNINTDDYNINRFDYGGQKIEVWADILTTKEGVELGTLITSINNRIASLAPKIYYCKKDGTGDFTSLVTAINTVCEEMDATLYIGPGVWDICSELGSDYMDNVSSATSTWGLVLKNRVHIIGSSNSTIIAKYTGTNAATREYFSAFNAGQYGFTLENLNIETDNIRYTIHDDRGAGGGEGYCNRYINCSMKHTNGMYTDCIGGGLGTNGIIEIINCHFEGDDTATRLVYYHGNNYRGQTDAQCKIICKENYFAGVGTFGLTKYGDSTKVSTAYVSDNSVGSALFVNSGSYAPNDNMRMIAWNNEVRS